MFEKKEKAKKRFIVKETQNLGMGALQIIVDTATGVNYLNTVGGSAPGLTPLLDKNGNVVIDDINEINED
ncbi:MAG: hypothetical protein IJY19_07795 [Ruminococcus sp.]|nr:hypothetical protein [Ruminococcus sp.]